ncbi:MAG: SxtJ family membrane protein [Gemmatimonadales bacterium]
MSPREGRRFGLPVGGVAAAFGAVAWWRGGDRLGPTLLAGGVLLLAAGLAVPERLGPVYRTWMGLAHLLSRITTPIALGVIYFLVLTPTGLLRRWIGSRPLERRPVNGSYWIDRATVVRPPADMERQF